MTKLSVVISVTTVLFTPAVSLSATVDVTLTRVTRNMKINYYTAARADSSRPILWVVEWEVPLFGSCPMNTSSGCRR